MKTLLDIGRLLLVTGLVVFFTPAVLAQDTGVRFDRKGIVIQPGTKISKEDEQALNEVLKKYDTRLYRLDKYKNGKMVKGYPKGHLKNGPGPKDIFIDAKTASDVANAKAAGVSDYGPVFETGQYDKRVPLQDLSNGTAMGKQLLKEITPILEKYRAK